jgi:hypothetical protein
MNTILDLSAFAAAGGVLAYQLICLQSEQRELREAINDRLSNITPELNLKDLKEGIVSSLLERLSYVAPVAPAPAAATKADLPDEVTPR